MRRRITRALFATAAAGATITSLSLAAAGTASAAVRFPVINGTSAGWAAGNVLTPTLIRTSSTWNFRYASGTTTLADVAGNSDLLSNTGRETFSVQLSNRQTTFAGQAYYAGGMWSVQFVQFYRNPAFTRVDVTPANCNTGAGGFHVWYSGDRVRLDVYYAQGTGQIEFTAYNGPDRVCSASTPAWTNPGSVGGGSFREAFVGGVFSPAADTAPLTVQGDPYVDGLSGWTRPAATVNLFPVRNVHYTSYNGTHGSVIGPWNYRELIFGTSFANIYADSPFLFNSGQNFSVWLRS